MVDVMYGRGEQRCQLLQGGEDGLQGRRAQQHAGSLHHVRRVRPVVVRHLLQVVTFQCYRERDERARWDFERVEKVSLLWRVKRWKVQIGGRS